MLDFTVRVETPNDPKLSDTRLGRDCCAAGERRRLEAAGVTETRVRCSAWLGVTLLEQTSQATTGQKRESALRTKLRKGQNRRLVETDETTECGKLGLAETVARSERQTAGLGEDMELGLTKACISGDGIDSRQTPNEA